MYKKILCCMLIILSTVVPAGAAATVTPENIHEIEMLLYGEHHDLSAADKLIKIEEDVFGTTYEDDRIFERLNRLENYIYGGEIFGASLGYRLSVLEWIWFSEVSYDPLLTRLEALENDIGRPQTGGVLSRVEAITSNVVPGGRIYPETVTVPDGLTVVVRAAQSISSETASIGDRVLFEVASDVYYDDYLIIPKGSFVSSSVKDVSEPWYFGRSGRLELDFDYVEALDGTRIPLRLGDARMEDSHSLLIALGASVGGLILFKHPVGLLVGGFIQGDHVTMGIGSRVEVQLGASREVEAVEKIK